MHTFCSTTTDSLQLSVHNVSLEIIGSDRWELHLCFDAGAGMGMFLVIGFRIAYCDDGFGVNRGQKWCPFWKQECLGIVDITVSTLIEGGCVGNGYNQST